MSIGFHPKARYTAIDVLNDPVVLEHFTFVKNMRDGTIMLRCNSCGKEVRYPIHMHYIACKKRGKIAESKEIDR